MSCEKERRLIEDRLEGFQLTTPSLFAHPSKVIITPSRVIITQAKGNNKTINIKLTSLHLVCVFLLKKTIITAAFHWSQAISRFKRLNFTRPSFSISKNGTNLFESQNVHIIHLSQCSVARNIYFLQY